jgi:hypothetical protein
MTLSDKERVDKINEMIWRLDRILEHLHNCFGYFDREIQPMLNDINHARMGMENLKITLERSGKR